MDVNPYLPPSAVVWDGGADAERAQHEAEARSRFDYRNAIRMTVIAQWTLIVAAGVMGSVLESRLPPELSAWVRAKSATEWNGLELVWAGVEFCVLLALLAASVGLCFYRRWSAITYLVATGLFMPASLLLGPQVDHAVSYFLNDCATLLSGATIALILSSGILTRRRVATSSNPEVAERI